MSDPSRRVHRVALGTGSPEGENSAYVLPGRRVVIDPGPPTEDAWERLRGGVADAGLALSDVEYVLVTHWHADHAGLAPRLAEAAGATVVLHEDDTPLVAEYARERKRRVERDARQLRRWGVPESVVDGLRRGDRPSSMPDSVHVEDAVDGEAVAVATDTDAEADTHVEADIDVEAADDDSACGGIEVVHVPGHTLGHTAFACDEGLFVGDLVLPTYTPNVGGGDTRMTDALATYLDSLGRIRERGTRRGADEAHPGHGSSFALSSRIDAIVAHHDERSHRTVAALGERSEGAGATPWDVAKRLFGEMDGIHVKMGAGEAASHLEFLRQRGAVERVEEVPATYRVVDADLSGVER